MWREIIGGAGLISVLLVIVGIQNKRIDKKMNYDVCVQRCKNTDHSFEAMQKQQENCQKLFKELFEKLNEQSGNLIEVKTILNIAANKNGWK